jgi:AAA family ATP:ADP antiporter
VAVARAFFTLMMAIAGHTVLETARDALFLSKLPPRDLNLVYVALAGLSFVAAGLTSRAVAALGRRRSFLWSLLLTAAVSASLHLVTDSRRGVWTIYLFTGVAAGMLIPQFWGILARSFTIEQGRRLFGPLASGGVLGGVLGAGLAALLLRFASVPVLLFVAAFFFVPAAVAARGIQELGAPSLRASTPGPFRPEPLEKSGEAQGKALLLRLAGLVVTSSGAVLALDYLFKSSAAAAIPKEQLGTFFAVFYALLNVSALVVQLFVASRAIAKFGVTGAVGIAPTLLLLFGAASVVSGGSFIVVLLARGVDGSLRNSLQRVTTELLYLPVPAHARDRSKTTIDTVFTRLAQAVTAGGLYALATMGFATPRRIALVVVGLCILWSITCALVRAPYLALFKRSLREGTMSPLPHTGTPITLDLDSAELAVESLASGDVAHVLAGIAVLERHHRERLLPALILYHDSEVVLSRALNVLAGTTRKDWHPLAQRLLADPRDGVRMAAVSALTRSGNLEQVKNRAELWTIPRVGAYLTFQEVLADSPAQPSKDLRLDALLDTTGEELVEVRRGLFQAVSDATDPRAVDLFLKLIQHQTAGATPSPRAIRDIGRALRRMADSRIIPVAIDGLGSFIVRDEMRETLVSFGAPALEALREAFFADTTPRRSKIHIPRTVARFDSQEAADILVTFLESKVEGALRYEALRALGRLTDGSRYKLDMKQFERMAHDNVVSCLRLRVISKVLGSGGSPAGTLLSDLIAEKSRQAKERAFRLLKIRFIHPEIENAYRASNESDSHARASALEFFDVMFGPNRLRDLRDLFRLVFDEDAAGDFAERVAPFTGPVPTTRRAALKELLSSPDRMTSALAERTLAQEPT